jgi:hypothetical protein
MNWHHDLEWEHNTLEVWRKRGHPEELPPPRCYRAGPLAAIISRDDLGEDRLRWHISLAHESRIPTWEELVMAAHDLRPGVPLVIGIPPRSWWVNVHPHVLHMTELRDQPLIDQWRFERQGHEPT